ncbi:MAG: thioredoxin family protein [Pirellulaceae bacterium]|nr:thioredoxin family protein [Pirellulaceae bacterium]
MFSPRKISEYALSTLTCASAWVIVLVSLQADEPNWIRDFEKGKQEAAAHKQDMFVVFTGHSWCHSCGLLNDQVFKDDAFLKALSKDFTFVELDFSFADTPEEDQRKATFTALQERFLVKGFPTVVLIDPTGQVYSFIIGYETDSGVESYLRDIAKARAAKAKRDELLKNASRSTGVERGKLLDEAISAMEPQFGSIEDFGDDPVLYFCGPIIKQIFEADTEGGAYAKKYIDRRKKRDQWQAKEAVYKKLDEFEKSDDYTLAIKYIEEVLPTITDDTMRWKLEFARQVYFEWSDRNEEALANSRRLQELPNITESNRDSLLQRESYNLFRLKRIDEGISHADRTIAATTDAEKKARLLSWKAMMIATERPAEYVKTLEECIKLTERGTNLWESSVSALAREFRRTNQFEESLMLVNELLDIERSAGGLIFAADCQIALGNRAAAEALLAEAKQAITKLAESQRKDDIESVKNLKSEIEKSFEQLRNPVTTNDGTKLKK